MSRSVRTIREPIWKPLLRMLRCESMAAFGVEVVPEVNWILTMSWGSSRESGFGDRAEVSWDIADQGVRARREDVEIWPSELSTKMTD